MVFLKRFLEIFFEGVWALFSIEWPGLNFPIGYAFLGVSFGVIVLRLFLGLFSVSLGSSVSGVAGSGKHIAHTISKNAYTISKNRLGDEK